MGVYSMRQERGHLPLALEPESQMSQSSVECTPHFSQLYGLQHPSPLASAYPNPVNKSQWPVTLYFILF